MQMRQIVSGESCFPLVKQSSKYDASTEIYFNVEFLK